MEPPWHPVIQDEASKGWRMQIYGICHPKKKKSTHPKKPFMPVPTSVSLSVKVSYLSFPTSKGSCLCKTCLGWH